MKKSTTGTQRLFSNTYVEAAVSGGTEKVFIDAEFKTFLNADSCKVKNNEDDH